MKPFVYNKGLGLLELHQSTESKIRKSLTRPWWRFWLIFDLISRYIFFKSTSQENRKKKFFAHMGNTCSFSHIHMALSFDKFFPPKIVRASNLQC